MSNHMIVLVFHIGILLGAFGAIVLSELFPDWYECINNRFENLLKLLKN
jgi:xanthine/uracil permease